MKDAFHIVRAYEIKIDSRKKNCKKASGLICSTISLATNVANVYSNIPDISTGALETHANIEKMAEGFMKIFVNAKVNQPKAIYIENNCFSPGKVADLHANGVSPASLVFGISCVALKKEQQVHTIHCTAHSLGDCQIASSNRTVVIMPSFWKPKRVNESRSMNN